MRLVAVSDVTVAQLTALVRCATLVEGGPYRGVHVGPGRHVAMPEKIAEDDLLSGDVARTIGWTHCGVWRGKVVLTDATAAVIAGTAKDATGSAIDPLKIVKDPKTLADAQSALTKTAVIVTAERLER